ncbi:DUF3813 domain-containing protein [Peribacillus sp. SI8-4]|uniref:DUF3813 domain-containing protein n=1 Tax=Peribacillus sp. SI8-4 TaxID=3048009 RepID=UPI0025562207|nr:DUF3813 domain-containing protein [Peribacillus sp. SI8-4]
MANKLFQKAKEFVEEALHSEHEHDGDQRNTEDIAKNALSSAFANSTEAEKEQLREFQEDLENHSK